MEGAYETLFAWLLLTAVTPDRLEGLTPTQRRRTTGTISRPSKQHILTRHGDSADANSLVRWAAGGTEATVGGQSTWRPKAGGDDFARPLHA
ncbi:hypothetical protein IQ07DRAFT_586382 [Pyrenochaeta sp. DS3sAY3a]|nr:hypothetical protein IQ07DRAFT_586382 [Pyrenochaeta sp. DS3sAY3a]